MPIAPPKICGHPGCALYATPSSAYCQQHRRAQRERDQARRNSYPRESRQSRGYDRQWERVRAVYLQRQPLCEDCIMGDRITPAVMVHHIESVEDRPELRLHMSNLRALCRTCHEQLHGRTR